MEKIWKDDVKAYFKVLCQYSSNEAENNHEVPYLGYFVGELRTGSV